MFSKYRMSRMRMPGGIEPTIGFEPYFVIEDMPGLASGETVFDVFRQGPGRFVAVGKQSFTTRDGTSMAYNMVALMGCLL